MLTFDPGALSDLIKHTFGAPPKDIVGMPGGASTRRYFRVLREGEPTSLVAMFVPDARPEEVTTKGTEATRWPFLEVHALLRDRNIRVPKIYGEACDQGLLLIEDLGDVTLGAFIKESPERTAEIYRTAVTDLAAAQKSLSELPASSVVSSRAFDETLLRWELDHFREWGLDALEKTLSPADLAKWNDVADRLAKRIAGWPRGFVHRDYQSRNLMVKTRADGSAELVWIDFQDALLGPRVYDLVALLNDSYVSFDRAFLEARLDEYTAAHGLSKSEREAVGREVDVLTVQRKLKDAGRFIFIDRVKKNPSFLPYFDPSIRKVKAALERLSDEEDMRFIADMLKLTFG
ncbi:MAG: phosphotransferase [Polyangiaceae bacterium]|nr:phosphotransferase [Polyangiaceae bacterium]